MLLTLILIEAVLLFEVLTAQDWTSSANIVYTVPAYSNDTLLPGAGLFYCNGRIEFGETRPFTVPLDHEYQHALYWDRNNRDCVATDKAIEQDFRNASSRHTHCINKTIEERATDIPHWPHFVINCVGRDKSLLPKTLADKWFFWLKEKFVFRLMLPIGSRAYGW